MAFQVVMAVVMFVFCQAVPESSTGKGCAGPEHSPSRPAFYNGRLT